MTRRIYLDVETVATEAALALPPDEEFLMKGVASTWGTEAIEKHRAKQATKWAEENAIRAATDWRLGQLVAIGFAVDQEEPTVLMNADERSLVADFWRYAGAWGRDVAFVGFAIRTFDLPWLLGRSGALNIRATRGFDLRKFGGPIVDWAEILGGEGSRAGWTLDRYAAWMQLSVKPVGHGSEVAGWWATGNVGAIETHCWRDLETTRCLDRRFAPAYFPHVGAA